MTASFEIQATVRLTRLAAPTMLSVRQFVLAVAQGGAWIGRLAGYEYAVLDASSGEDLFAYHWHPAGRSHLVEPHLHLGNASLTAMGASRGIHFPTGPIPFRDFTGMLIRECGAKPQRRDWERVLRESTA